MHDLLIDKVLPADALVYATPIWWYGVTGMLKTFIDRIFCYIAYSYPDCERVAEAVQWKRAALVLSAEESNFSARLAIVQQMQEVCRYLHHSLVGIVSGIGNRRGDVRDDPNRPLESIDREVIEAARTMGADDRRIFTTVVLPLIRPYMIAGFSFVFVLSMNEFIISYFLGQFAIATLPVKIFSQLRSGYSPVIASTAVLFMLLAVAVFGLIARFGDLPKLLGAWTPREE